MPIKDYRLQHAGPQGQLLVNTTTALTNLLLSVRPSFDFDQGPTQLGDLMVQSSHSRITILASLTR
jgi:hypothetical protein